GSTEGLLIAFLGDLDEEQGAVAARMRQRAGAGVAFVLDSTGWTQGSGPGDRAEERLRQLREAGWTALAVPSGAELPELWRQAARQNSESAVAGGPTGFSGGWS
ncbi:DUF58 domain-containing protein, partial [Streptomyces sp. NPDC087850]